MRTRIHPPCDPETFKKLCAELGLRADAWREDAEGGFLFALAGDDHGVRERHVIYPDAARAARAERARRDEFVRVLTDTTRLEHRLAEVAHARGPRPEHSARVAAELAWERDGLEDHYERLDALDRAERATHAP